MALSWKSIPITRATSATWRSVRRLTSSPATTPTTEKDGTSACITSPTDQITAIRVSIKISKTKRSSPCSISAAAVVPGLFILPSLVSRKCSSTVIGLPVRFTTMLSPKKAPILKRKSLSSWTSFVQWISMSTVAAISMSATGVMVDSNSQAKARKSACFRRSSRKVSKLLRFLSLPSSQMPSWLRFTKIPPRCVVSKPNGSFSPGKILRMSKVSLPSSVTKKTARPVASRRSSRFRN